MLALSLARPAPARAYLIDLNDARVVDHGSMELELQPLGYYQTLLGDEEHYLIAPSAQIYWGLAEGWDVLYLTRGWGRLDEVPDQSPYTVEEQMVAFRVMLRDGAYSDEEADGPSITLQWGLLLPGIDAEIGFGATVALLFAQEWDVGTLHLNAWANLTHERAFNLFVSAVIEGPPEWPARPVIEVWFDLEVGDEGEVPALSGLLGIVVDVSDEFALQGGARVGGFDDRLDLEVRVSSWAAFELWDPSPPVDEQDATSMMRPCPTCPSR